MKVSKETATRVNNQLKAVRPETVRAVAEREYKMLHSKGPIPHADLDPDPNTAADAVHSLTSTMRFCDLVLVHGALTSLMEQSMGGGESPGLIVVLS